MGLFQRKPESDAELESRADRLQSECRQARLYCESLPDGVDKQNRLKDLEVAEQAVAEARAEGDKAARIRAALRAEAELCLTKPVPLLVPTANRLREKLYRLDSKRREEAWEKYLDRLTRNGDALDEQAEQAVRFRLKSLTYESTEAAERYERLAKERSSAIQAILTGSFVIVIVLLAGVMWSLNGLMLDCCDGVGNTQDCVCGAALSWKWLKLVFFAGGLGAMITIVPSTINERKKRSDYSRTYIWHMVVRVVLGGVYAFIVYSATLAHVLPLAIPAEPEMAIPFLAVLGFASGFSDRLFSQVLTNLITGKSSSKKKDGVDQGT